MMLSVPDALHVPTQVWERGATRSMLRARNMAAVLRLVQQHTGASQTRLAVATGLSQGRVNEIINGKREITRIDVFERVAAGLGMPDGARMDLGLAPVRPEARRSERTSAERQGEIDRMFVSQHDAEPELRQQAQTAGHIQVLAVRGLGLLGLNDSLLRPGLARARRTPCRLRVLLLDPHCPAAARRAEEIGESTESFARGIELATARLRELHTTAPGVHLEVYHYRGLPIWRVFSFDDVMYLSTFTDGREGHESPVYRLSPGSGGMLHNGFRRVLDRTFGEAERIV